MMRTVRQRVEQWLAPRLRQVARADANATTLDVELDALIDELLAELGTQVKRPLLDLAGEIDGRNARALAALGVDVRAHGLGDLVQQTITRNVSLLRNAGREYADQVEAILADPASLGLRVEELADLIAQRGDVAESRAMLIARDQTAKLNAGISAARQQAAGITRYEWSTSRDERVRESHRANEGRIFRFDSPPVETGNPGDDIQCRCVAIPVIDGLDDGA